MLLPCPFCGTTPNVIKAGNALTVRAVTVKCPECRVSRTDRGWILSMEQLELVAEKAWNTRFLSVPSPTKTTP